MKYDDESREKYKKRQWASRLHPNSHRGCVRNVFIPVSADVARYTIAEVDEVLESLDR